MASKRNSRVFSDESSFYDDFKQKSSSASYRSRRSSRGSLKEEMFQVAADLEEGHRGSVVLKEVATTIRYQSSIVAAKDSAPLPPSRSEKTGTLSPPFNYLPCCWATANTCKPARHASILPTIPQAVNYPAAPLEGRPLNFGVVIPGLYRSSYPKPHDYDYLKSLELKTVV